MKVLLFILSILLLSGYVTETALAQLTVYSGRSKALVEPLIQEFEKETGIRVRVRYGGTTQLAVALMEEGRRTPADIFWAQDGGALGAVHQAGLLALLPQDLSDALPAAFRNSDGTWVATSGRARVLAYHRSISTDKLPSSLGELTQPQWSGKVGWAPSNASFQSFVTAMRALYGEEATRQWLLDMKNNRPVAYNNNSSILQALAAGEVDLGLTNHYYLERAKSTNPDFPVNQRFFDAGDPGNLINVAGLCILNASSSKDQAIQFIRFMLRESSQSFFLNEVFEYPVIQGLGEQDAKLDEVLRVTPEIDLDILRDLEDTLKLLRETGLL